MLGGPAAAPSFWQVDPGQVQMLMWHTCMPLGSGPEQGVSYQGGAIGSAWTPKIPNGDTCYEAYLSHGANTTQPHLAGLSSGWQGPASGLLPTISSEQHQNAAPRRLAFLWKHREHLSIWRSPSDMVPQVCHAAPCEAVVGAGVDAGSLPASQQMQHCISVWDPFLIAS